VKKIRREFGINSPFTNHCLKTASCRANSPGQLTMWRSKPSGASLTSVFYAPDETHTPVYCYFITHDRGHVLPFYSDCYKSEFPFQCLVPFNPCCNAGGIGDLRHMAQRPVAYAIRCGGGHPCQFGVFGGRVHSS